MSRQFVFICEYRTKMDEFISIAVGQGDAFYLQRSGFKVLVDGGRSRKGFYNQFRETIGQEILDVVICTHADADHINGLIGYFESGARAREVWLPGKWTSRLEDLLVNPDEFVSELERQVRNLKLEGINSLEDYCDNGELERTASTEGSDSIDDLMCQAMENETEWMTWTGLKEWWVRESILGHRMPPANLRLLFDAIDTAKKIRSLAVEAYHSGAKIRWFEYDSVSNSGGDAKLKPVNSKEIFTVSSKEKALRYLSLSKSNKQSLVFYSPGENQGSGSVLFCADSDFSFANSLSGLGEVSIVTAPHHGSESNKNVYERLLDENIIKNNTIVVRSDGKFKKRPGLAYINGSFRRICTLCRNSKVKQDVVLKLSGIVWARQQGKSWCTCN